MLAIGIGEPGVKLGAQIASQIGVSRVGDEIDGYPRVLGEVVKLVAIPDPVLLDILPVAADDRNVVGVIGYAHSQ